MAAKKGKDAKAKGKDKGKGKGKGKKEEARHSSVSSKRASADKPVKAPPPPPPKPDPCELYVPDECFENVTCRFNEYPALLDKPKPMAIVGSETGSYKSLFELLEAGLRCADRVLLMTPWGNYVVFRANKPGDGMEPPTEELTYFLYDGCTCNVNSFRHLDLRAGAAGFITFDKPNPLISYILNSRYRREKMSLMCKQVLDDICEEKRPTGGELRASLDTSKHEKKNEKGK